MIDIIIPVYNSGKNIARSLNSVLDQVNYKDINVYIVDDCSTEDYKDIINHFSKYLNITYLRLDRLGISSILSKNICILDGVICIN